MLYIASFIKFTGARKGILEFIWRRKTALRMIFKVLPTITRTFLRSFGGEKMCKQGNSLCFTGTSLEQKFAKREISEFFSAPSRAFLGSCGAKKKIA